MWKTVTPVVLEECKEEAMKLKAVYEELKAQFMPGQLKKVGRSKGKKVGGKGGQILVQGSGDKPKRARTAYLIFCDRYRNQIMKVGGVTLHPAHSLRYFTKPRWSLCTTYSRRSLTKQRGGDMITSPNDELKGATFFWHSPNSDEAIW